MGARDNYETIARVVQAFAAANTWNQADLARRVGVEPRRLRTILTNLSSSGMPLEREEEHPHVYWSVPRAWFPGGVVFDLEDWEVLVNAVIRIPDPKRKEKLYRRLLSGRRVAASAEQLKDAVVGTPLSSDETSTVLAIERSWIEGCPISIRYFSGSRGALGWRVVSPQKLVTEPRSRLLAFCHENNDLRWFRVDNMSGIELKAGEHRIEVPPAEVEEFIRTSVDGFQDGTNQELFFVVRGPATNWVRGNLLPGMNIVSQKGDEFRVMTTGGAVVVARFIAGLGGAAIAESDALRAMVKEIAEKALASHG